MHGNRRCRYIAALALLGIVTLIFFILNIRIGSVRIAWPDIIKTLAGQESGREITRILWDIRLPRTAAVLLLGGALALAGYLLQTFFNNPIAGPFVLGISSGAKMTVALVMVFLVGGSGSICRCDVRHGFCASDVAQSPQYANVGSQRRDDWIYMLGDYGIGDNVCQ